MSPFRGNIIDDLQIGQFYVLGERVPVKGRTDTKPDLLVEVEDGLMLGLARAYHATNSN